jgi:hypothetical protein
MTLLDDPQINAANAGGGECYVATGLLGKAIDDQLRGALSPDFETPSAWLSIINRKL